MRESIQNILDLTFFNNSIENYLWFFGVILLVLVFKRFLSKRFTGLLFKLFRKIMPSMTELDSFLVLLIGPLELLIVILAVSFAFDFLQFPSASENAMKFKGIISVILNIAIVFIVTWVVMRIIDFLTALLSKQAEKTETKVDDQIILFVKEAAKLITIIFSFLFILGAVFELNIGSLVAGLGIGGLAIALAAQDTLENLIASFIIFFDKPFLVGDFINVGETYGVVEKIGFRSTRIRTLEKSYLTVPNKSLINRELDNLSLRTFRRSKFHVGLTYSTTTKQLHDIIRDIQKYIDEHELTNQDGLVRFEEFGDSSLNLMVVYYVKTKDWGEYMSVKEDINFKIMDIVSDHGSDFAFPTQTIHMHKES